MKSIFKKNYWNEPFDFKSLKMHTDERGSLFEILRFKEQQIPEGGQIYTFSINPNKRRGDHYHLYKQEWFTCVLGCATVLLTSSDNKNLAITLTGKRPTIVYVGTGTSHALINKNDLMAIIVSYGSAQHNPKDEDTYRKIAYEGYNV